MYSLFKIWVLWINKYLTESLSAIAQYYITYIPYMQDNKLSMWKHGILIETKFLVAFRLIKQYQCVQWCYHGNPLKVVQLHEKICNFAVSITWTSLQIWPSQYVCRCHCDVKVHVVCMLQGYEENCCCTLSLSTISIRGIERVSNLVVQKR